ncbi:MAG: cardiolipin synthase [Ruminococcaceae bacterium]|nr:cardiolipin synthase [Oscillospiraceae bacterium]
METDSFCEKVTTLHKKYLKSFTGRLITTALFAVLQIVAFIVMTVALSSYAVPIFIVMTVISALVVLFIINTERNPAYKLLWSIVILVFPIFGGLMFLAASVQSSTYLFKKRAKKAKALIAPYCGQDTAITAAMRAESRTKANHASYLAEKASFPVYRDTAVTYFPSGEAKFEWMKAEIRKAKKFIFLEYFIIQEGIMWDSILKLLIAKVKEGVEVRLIWDGMGCMSTLPKNYDKILEGLGIHVMIFNPFVPLATVVQNNRDHRKILVIDGHTAFTGGVNLADEYINAFDRFGHWKDAAVMLKGDAVRSFTLMFLEHWYMSKPADPDITAYFHHPAPGEFLISDPRSSGYVQPYGDTPLDGECVGELVYFNLINKAKDYIYIMTPYLIPDNELVSALCFAAKSGIDVRIITPHIPDKWYVFQVTRSFYKPLLDAGVKIYEYTPGFIHSKVVVADDSIGVCGSINFDYRSLYLHFECAALIYDNPAVMDMKYDFVETLKVCEEITPERYKKIRGKHGLVMSLLKLFAPLL